MSLIGIDLAIPNDTDMNRNPNPRSCKDAKTKKQDPPPLANPDFRAPCVRHSTRHSSFVLRKTHLEQEVWNSSRIIVDMKEDVPMFYSLGEEAKIEDMAVFNPEEQLLALGRLSENDYVFVRRSGGRFSFATVKSVEPDSADGMVMQLYVNEAGATKSIPMDEWVRYICPIKQYVKCNPSSHVCNLSEGKRRSHIGDRRTSCPGSMQEVEEHEEPNGNNDDPEFQRDKSQRYRLVSMSNRRSSCTELRQDCVSEDNESKNRNCAPAKQDSLKHPSMNRSFVTSKLDTKGANLEEHNTIKKNWKRQNSSESKASPNELEGHSVVPNVKERHSSAVERQEATSPKMTPDEYINRHLNTVDINEHTIRMCESPNNDAPCIRQTSQNTCDTMKSSIRTNYGNMLRKSSLRSSQSSIEDDIDYLAIDDVDDLPCDVSRHVQWDIASQSQSPDANLRQKSAPDISDTTFTRPELRRAKTEHEFDGSSEVARHVRRVTADDIGKDQQQSVASKNRHSRRRTVGGGLTESQKFDESHLLSAFASILQEK